jgi:hypothetical protein
MEVRRIQPSNRNEENLLQWTIWIFFVQRNSITKVQSRHAVKPRAV